MPKLNEKREYWVGFDHDGCGYEMGVSGKELLKTIEDGLKKGWKGEELIIHVTQLGKGHWE